MNIAVLLADDHAVVRDGLCLILESNRGIRVVGQASTGREALAKVEELHPDVVLMDISMPELNGLEAARMIRERFPRTAVIVLSMHSSAEYVYRALQAGVCGYVLKESAGREVVDAVRAANLGRRYLSAKLAEKRLEYFSGLDDKTQRSSPLDRLSPREREVLQLVVEGRSSAEIARMVFLSPKTVETYRSRLMTKLGVSDVPALVKFAVAHGLTPPA